MNRICVLIINLLIIFRNSPKLSFVDWNKYLDEISKTKSIDSNEIKGKLVNCGKPGLSGTTVSSKEFNQCILHTYVYCREIGYLTDSKKVETTTIPRPME